jgi:serine/threonine protein kinase
VGLRGGRWDDPVVLDLGLVRDLVGDSITVYPHLIGTGLWMAPEQLRQERAVKRSDIYAVGVMLFSALARRHPFFAAVGETLTLLELDARIADSAWPDFAAPQPIAADIRPELARLLAYEAFERPKAGAAAAAIEQLTAARGGP